MVEIEIVEMVEMVEIVEIEMAEIQMVEIEIVEIEMVEIVEMVEMVKTCGSKLVDVSSQCKTQEDDTRFQSLSSLKTLYPTDCGSIPTLPGESRPPRPQ